MVEDLLTVVRAVAPELEAVLERRYALLRLAEGPDPIGRRALAQRLGWAERTVRGEIELLRQQGFVSLDARRISLTASGARALAELRRVMRVMHGTTELSRRLSAHFRVAEVIVVPGDIDDDDAARDNMVRAAAERIMSLVRPGDVVAVSGGSTLARVAAQLHRRPELALVTVVPTGGGLGDVVEIEANSVAAQFARSLGCRYRLLHMRDDLDDEVVTLLRKQPAAAELFALIRSARIVVQGIGVVADVASRRAFEPERVAKLVEQGAAGEMLGNFLDLEGSVVQAAGNVGLRLADLTRVEQVVAVAGGASKRDALQAVLSAGLHTILVTDEGAARAVAARLEEPAGAAP